MLNVFSKCEFNKLLLSIKLNVMPGHQWLGPVCCNAVLPFSQRKSLREIIGGMARHMALDMTVICPAALILPTGKTHEVAIDRKSAWTLGTITTFDRAFIDFAWFASLIRHGVWFVTWAKDSLAS